MQKFSKKKLYQLIAILVVILILAVIGVFSLSEKTTSNELKSELNLSSEITLSVINPNRIENGGMLIGDREAILKDKDVAWLQGEVKGLGNVFLNNGVDALYLLVKRGANVYFLVESTPYGEDLYIEPGTLYKNPPQEVYDVFNKKTTSYTDFYTDEYGTYMSKFTPIFNDSNQLVGVLGTDIDYNYFQDSLNKTRLLLIALLIVVFSVAYFVIFYIRKKDMIAQEVEDNNIRINELINSIPNGIVVFDKNERIDLWNQTAKEMFGYKPEEVEGKKVSDVVKYDKVFKSNSDEEIKNFNFFINKNNLSRKLELRIKNEDSTLKVIELVLDRMEIGDKMYSIALFEDISNRKLKEFEIERQKNKLEKLNSLMVDRELKMVEIKNQLAKLKEKENEENINLEKEEKRNMSKDEVKKVKTKTRKKEKKKE